jgi:hypothetical protein
MRTWEATTLPVTNILEYKATVELLVVLQHYVVFAKSFITQSARLRLIHAPLVLAREDSIRMTGRQLMKHTPRCTMLPGKGIGRVDE